MAAYATDEGRIDELLEAGIPLAALDVWISSKSAATQDAAAEAVDKVSMTPAVRNALVAARLDAIVETAQFRALRCVAVLDALLAHAADPSTASRPTSHPGHHDPKTATGGSLATIEEVLTPVGSAESAHASNELTDVTSGSTPGSLASAAASSEELAAKADVVDGGSHRATLFLPLHACEGLPASVSLASDGAGAEADVAEACLSCAACLRVLVRLMWHSSVSREVCRDASFARGVVRLLTAPDDALRRAAAIVVGSLIHQHPDVFRNADLPRTLLLEAMHIRNPPETLRQLVHALYWTAACGEDWAAALVRRNACRLAIPIMYHESTPAAFRACQFCATLASYAGVVRTAVVASGALDHVGRLARATRPEALRARGTNGPSVLTRRATFLSRHHPVEVRLVAAISITAHLDASCFDPAFRGAAAASVAHAKKLAPLVAALREACCGGHELVYYHCARCLTILGESPPFFEPRRAVASETLHAKLGIFGTVPVVAEAASAPSSGAGSGAPGGAGSGRPKPLAEWSIREVGQWVASQPFRAYAAAFVESLVDGQTMLMLSGELLEAMGVAHPVHRLAIANSISRLASKLDELEEGGEDEGGDDAAAGAPLRHSRPARAALGAMGSAAGGAAGISSAGGIIRGMSSRKARKFDVFVSYRRIGGGQLAQLLKMLLEARGMHVFLDTDDLGHGNFQENLMRSLLSSANVVSVCTNGSLDRCCEPPENGMDFVRLELQTSLAKGINIVPVFHDFNFEIKDRLPPSIGPAVASNGVIWRHEYAHACVDKIVSLLVPNTPWH